MLKGYRYRIYPTKEQVLVLAKHFGCARFIYNWALAQRQKSYQESKKHLSKKELQNEIVHNLKKSDDTKWLN